MGVEWIDGWVMDDEFMDAWLTLIDA